MTYVCIYNPGTKTIDGAESYKDAAKASERYGMYVTECMARGAPWTSYTGDKPFAFPEPPVVADNPAPEPEPIEEPAEEPEESVDA